MPVTARSVTASYPQNVCHRIRAQRGEHRRPLAASRSLVVIARRPIKRRPVVWPRRVRRIWPGWRWQSGWGRRRHDRRGAQSLEVVFFKTPHRAATRVIGIGKRLTFLDGDHLAVRDGPRGARGQQHGRSHETESEKACIHHNVLKDSNALQARHHANRAVLKSWRCAASMIARKSTPRPKARANQGARWSLQRDPASIAAGCPNATLHGTGFAPHSGILNAQSRHEYQTSVDAD